MSGFFGIVRFDGVAVENRVLENIAGARGGIAGALYLLRLSLSPTQEDWNEGAEERRSWLLDAARRPFRLFRKYGSNE